jgi:hypothetical protein
VQRVSVGIGVRDAQLEELARLRDRKALDVLEVMIDDGLEPSPRVDAWRALGARWPLVAHGTELGVGGADPPAPAYLDRVGRALSNVGAQWYSEHLAFLGTASTALGHFAPLGDGADALGVLRENAALVRGGVRCPFLLENPSDILGWEVELGGKALGERYARALEASEAGALLDLTNLVLDARNGGFSVGEFLDVLPWERVVEIHLAGGRYDGTLHIDSHDHDVDAEALSLLGEAARRATNLRAVIIERDDRLPGLAHLLHEVERVRVELGKAGRA